MSDDVPAANEAQRARQTRRNGRKALALALRRGEQAIAQLIERSGGAWDLAEAAYYMQTTVETIDQWRREGLILGLAAADGTFRYPVVQFRPDSAPAAARPIAGVSEVLSCAGGALPPLELFGILATPQHMLASAEGRLRSGFQALAEGGLAEVLALIRHVVTAADSEGSDGAANGGRPIGP